MNIISTDTEAQSKNFNGVYHKIYRVLAYLPKGNDTIPDSILPEGIELVHPRYAISWRNQWMIERSVYVIAYVTHNFGGAARFVDEAKRKGKTVINL